MPWSVGTATHHRPARTPGPPKATAGRRTRTDRFRGVGPLAPSRPRRRLLPAPLAFLDPDRYRDALARLRSTDEPPPPILRARQEAAHAWDRDCSVGNAVATAGWQRALWRPAAPLLTHPLRPLGAAFSWSKAHVSAEPVVRQCLPIQVSRGLMR
jgi:hypothetical protein